MFYVIIFGLLAVLLVVAGVTVLSRRRTQLGRRRTPSRATPRSTVESPLTPGGANERRNGRSRVTTAASVTDRGSGYRLAAVNGEPQSPG